METNDYNPEEEKALFIAGRLDNRRDYLFRKKMQEDDALREEVELLLAMRNKERTWSPSAVEAPAGDTAAREAAVIPFYRQPWFRIAASVLILAGIGWFVTSRPEPDTLTLSLPVRQSTDGALGWSEAGAEKIVTVIRHDKSATAGYSFFDDTLRIVTPSSLKTLSGKDALLLVDDLKNRRLVLVLEGKKYRVETNTRDTVLLEETQ